MLQFRESDNTFVKSDDLVIRNLNFSKKFCIDLKSAEMTYEAALMATGKVMQTTLLNFI